MKFKITLTPEQLETLLHFPERTLISELNIDESEEGSPKLQLGISDRESFKRTKDKEFIIDECVIDQNPICGHNNICWNSLPLLAREKNDNEGS